MRSQLSSQRHLDASSVVFSTSLSYVFSCFLSAIQMLCFHDVIHWLHIRFSIKEVHSQKLKMFMIYVFMFQLNTTDSF